MNFNSEIPDFMGQAPNLSRNFEFPNSGPSSTLLEEASPSLTKPHIQNKLKLGLFKIGDNVLVSMVTGLDGIRLDGTGRDGIKKFVPFSNLYRIFPLRGPAKVWGSR